jgi:hypothetical protein
VTRPATPDPLLPELTLGLRALGTRRGRPEAEHDRFFGPLLVALGAARRSHDVAVRLAALDAAKVAGELGAVVHGFAVERFPRRPAHQRALEAELGDLAAPVFDALAQLGMAAEAIARAPADGGDDAVRQRWGVWAEACRGVFVAADHAWLAIAPVLTGAPEAARLTPPWWRRVIPRVIRRGGGGRT